MKHVKLNNGVEMPMLGYGAFLVQEGSECVQAIKTALESGYRHIDTAAGYNNEDSVGVAIKESGKARAIGVSNFNEPIVSLRNKTIFFRR